MGICNCDEDLFCEHRYCEDHRKTFGGRPIPTDKSEGDENGEKTEAEE